MERGRRQVMNGCICCTVRGDLAEVLKGSLAQKMAGFDAVHRWTEAAFQWCLGCF